MLFRKKHNYQYIQESAVYTPPPTSRLAPKQKNHDIMIWFSLWEQEKNARK